MLALLPTDYIIWALITCLAALIFKNLSQPLAKKFWQQLLSNSVACCSLILVVLFSGITLFDSVHFQEQGRTYSLLDQVLKPIGTRDEVSYSAPLATKSFVNTTKFDQAKATSSKQPLQHVQGRDMQGNYQALIKILAKSTLLVLLIMAITAAYLKVSWFELMQNQQGQVAYRTIFVSLFFISFILLFIHDFSKFYYIFGTDKTGLEVLYQGLKSIRTGLAIGLITIMFMVPLATFFGIAAGFFGGRVDSIIQYIYTTLSSIPGVLLIAAAVLSLDMFMYKHADWFSSYIMRSDLRLLSLCFILGVTGWTSLCRLLRGEVLKLRELDFVVHAKVVGMNSFKIMYKHLLPNVMHIIIITAVLDFSGLVLAEAILSYIGVGVDPTMNSWGNMINAARLELSRDPVVWWPLVCAVALMFLLVVSINLLADKIRTMSDPRRF